MQRPDSPLNKLFDAARQEHSPLSDDDVRALLNEPQKPTRRPVMIPMLIAASIITIAGVTSSVVLRNDDSKTPNVAANRGQQRQPQSATTTRTTEPSEETSSTTTVESSASIKSDKQHALKSITTSNNNGAQPRFVWFEGGPEIPQAIGCRVRAILPPSADGTRDGSPRVYFATVTADREVTDRLSDASAPTPVLCTDVRGRACSTSDVAYFASNYKAIAGDLNNLVPVTYAGREDILVWYNPSPALVEAFPDSLHEDLEMLLDIDIDVDIDMNMDMSMAEMDLGGMKMMAQTYSMPSMDSMMTMLKNYEGGKYPQIQEFMKSGKLDSTMKMMSVQLYGFDSTMKNFDVKVLTCDSAMKDLDLKMKNLDIDLKNLDIDLKNLDIDMKNLDLNANQFYGMTPDGPKRSFKFHKKLKRDTVLNNNDNSNKNFRQRIVIKSNVRGPKKSKDAPQLEKLSELTPTRSGAIASTSVYPNPATEGAATMSYVLDEPRTLTLHLLDLSGTVVATLMENAKRPSGPGQFAFTLSNIPSGMYLVNMTTDKGERAIQRLIVE